MAKRESGTVSTRGIGVPKFNQEMLAATIAALAGITLVWTFSQPEFPVPVLIAAGAVFTVSIVMVIRLMMDPDSVRALQSDAMLQLASSMIDAMGDGLTEDCLLYTYHRIRLASSFPTITWAGAPCRRKL